MLLAQALSELISDVDWDEAARQDTHTIPINDESNPLASTERRDVV